LHPSGQIANVSNAELRAFQEHAVYKQNKSLRTQTEDRDKQIRVSFFCIAVTSTAAVYVINP